MSIIIRYMSILLTKKMTLNRTKKNHVTDTQKFRIKGLLLSLLLLLLLQNDLANNSCEEAYEQ